MSSLEVKVPLLSRIVVKKLDALSLVRYTVSEALLWASDTFWDALATVASTVLGRYVIATLADVILGIEF